MPRGQYIAGHAWTEEREQTLRRLWADGESASFIAQALGGLTRNAVIGKVHRLGLQPRARLRARIGGAAARYAPPAVGGMRASAVSNRKQEILHALPPAEALAASVAWDVRADDQCAWILGDTAGGASRCCGQPVDAPGKPQSQRRAMYCAAHNAAAKAPVQPKPPAYAGDRNVRRGPRGAVSFGAGWMK